MITMPKCWPPSFGYNLHISLFFFSVFISFFWAICFLKHYDFSSAGFFDCKYNTYIMRCYGPAPYYCFVFIFIVITIFLFLSIRIRNDTFFMRRNKQVDIYSFSGHIHAHIHGPWNTVYSVTIHKNGIRWEINSLQIHLFTACDMVLW